MAQRNRNPVAWMKVYDPTGNYKASCVDYAEAAVLVAFLGNGSQVRNGHGKKIVIWHEGHEDQSAAESYDHATAVMAARMMTHDSEFTPEQIAANDRAQQGLEQVSTDRKTMYRDMHLSRSDAVAVCRAIGMSLPFFSCQASRARLASIFCRFSRGADMWLCAGCFDRIQSLRGDTSLTHAAMSYLERNASSDVHNHLRLTWTNCVGEGGQSSLQVANLYDLLMRGWREDSRQLRLSRCQ